MNLILNTSIQAFSLSTTNLETWILPLAVLAAKCVLTFAGIVAERVVADRAILAGTEQALVDVLLAGRPGEPGGRAVTTEAVDKVLTRAIVLARLVGAVVDVDLAVPATKALGTQAGVALEK